MNAADFSLRDAIQRVAPLPSVTTDFLYLFYTSEFMASAANGIMSSNWPPNQVLPL